MYRYLKYDDTDICLEIAPITRVMAIKAKGSANYGPPCKYSRRFLGRGHQTTVVGRLTFQQVWLAEIQRRGA